MSSLIKALEGNTVHQIQSGQVIVDLCSVVKELVENSLDAGATAVDIRFKNYGLDVIEVQDNGSGVGQENFESLALKHYTSKLSSYDDLNELHTYGFRGEALSSLCALSQLSVVTAQAKDVPKGHKLEFETSGKLRNSSIAASQKGTTICVNDIFSALPVRRRELEKNIKREYAKAVGVLNAYACISVDVKFTASNVAAKAKKSQIFATKSNPSTKENISNVFGAKSVVALIPLDLLFEIQPTKVGGDHREVKVVGHVSKPTYGEGRQAPDRQMFFVNSRPCGLPQIAKAFNEVYKTYNLSQSPFIFANVLMDTSGYDVNVSPDKRTILLHDQAALLESLKQALIDLFDQQEHTVPRAQAASQDLPSFRQLTFQKSDLSSQMSDSDEDRSPKPSDRVHGEKHRTVEATKGAINEDPLDIQDTVDAEASSNLGSSQPETQITRPVRDFNTRLAEVESLRLGETIEVNSEADNATSASNIAPRNGIVANAFDRMRPRRSSPEMATITIGSKVIHTPIGSSPIPISARNERISTSKKTIGISNTDVFRDRLRVFASLDECGDASEERPNDPTLSEEVADDQMDQDSSSVSGNQSRASQDSLAAKRVRRDREHVTAEEEDDVDDPQDLEDVEQEEEHEDDEQEEQDEEKSIMPQSSQESQKRAEAFERGTTKVSDSSISLFGTIDTSINQIKRLAASQKRQPIHVSSQHQPYIEEAETVEEQLSLSISKSNFGNMQILGQFNLGFILARKGEDIFIIDQHASDEKYNFERLQATTIVLSQRLVRPQALDLTAMEEELVQDHFHVLLKNGFNVAVDTSGAKPVGKRCEMTSLPLSKDVTFDRKDFEELLSLLAESPNDKNLRPTKVRRMFAMRACRSSIMIGKTLSLKQMEKVVFNMGQIEKPWNCPHGRPTMRHLFGLKDWSTWDEDQHSPDWQAYSQD